MPDVRARRGWGGVWLIGVVVATTPAMAGDDLSPGVRATLARCASCHGLGPDDEDPAGGLDLTRRDLALKGGESGAALKPGDPTASLMLRKVVAGKMPPKTPLAPVEVEALRDWVKAGANWQTPLTRAEASAAVSAAKKTNLWSLRPVRRPEPPVVKDAAWARDPLDLFVLAGLEREGLRPAAEADRVTYIRRVTFDLIGLPPTPAEVDAFAADASPMAYERLADRLLASPHYGERWGRHWLDLARFAESHGFEYDRLRDNAWPYRDYVIRSLNADMPYARFVSEQIAGDVLASVTAESVAATGFLVAGPWDEAGIKAQKSSVMRERVREEELEDMISTVSQTFLGLTVNCARCHDHKFDPIPQRDYYRIKAVFEGVRHGDRPLPGPEKPARMVYASNPEKPSPTFILARGDAAKKGERVSAGGLSAVSAPGVAHEFGLDADAPESLRRRKFAAWVAHPDHPLTARVAVNRVWHYHFGTGLAGTPSDFGSNGEAPTHPALVDLLAADFRDAGGRFKPLHRRVVLSSTYRQSSAFNPGAASRDAEARLLWRFPPRRLEGEAVRDALLASSGLLNTRAGGPGFRPFVVRTFNSNFYEMMPDAAGPEFDRRTVYRIHVNSAKSPLLDALDCPDPSVKTPRRAVTTTPLQALGLMNDPFIWRASKALAARVRREAGDDPSGQVTLAYRLVLGREPRPAERETAAALVGRDGLDGLGWVLFNTNEFLTVR